jgi:integrase
MVHGSANYGDCVSQRQEPPASGGVRQKRTLPGLREGLPTPDETAAILSRASLEFQLIYAALRQCGARSGELCRATIADIDRKTNAIVLLREP